MLLCVWCLYVVCYRIINLLSLILCHSAVIRCTSQIEISQLLWYYIKLWMIKVAVVVVQQQAAGEHDQRGWNGMFCCGTEPTTKWTTIWASVAWFGTFADVVVALLVNGDLFGSTSRTRSRSNFSRTRTPGDHYLLILLLFACTVCFAFALHHWWYFVVM